MKHSISFFFATVLVADMLFTLPSCNLDEQLGKEENIPEIAEQLLEMPVQEAMEYLKTQGFLYGEEASRRDVYIFSRDGRLSEFSYEATARLVLDAFNDTVRVVEAIQHPKTEKAARYLFWKWSHYTAAVTLPKVEKWAGSLDGQSYTDGLVSQQMIDNYQNQYEKGEITQKEYDMWMRAYSKNQEAFWTDFKNAGANVKSAHEYYIDEALPKELKIEYDADNDGKIELRYETHNFVIRWE